ncbi:MAG TPA: NUDIX domain-containing protein [Acidimicrobiales bacterium]|jgi:8-oxo-dGTP pyrophosphatase MutT (NUDIX family)|nr:NUDIX domain-containing protein [Acidimicrobiales bacterium]HRA33891.1 NUDIX domain-containing protein [Acidimicrobiales bacterium]
MQPDAGSPPPTADQVPLRDAATVLVLRDGREGLEVFMLQRNLNSDFVGGAYVFPGGAVDPVDRASDLEDVCLGRGDLDASTRLGIERGGLAFWVAAIRESFEEAGILLAVDPEGRFVDLDAEAGLDRWAVHRREVDQGRRRLVEVCTEEALRLAVGEMHYFGHWITPVGAPRRYDTRFFLAAAPANQTPLHDDREVIANEWVRPIDALHRCLAGDITMMPPTISSLKAMTRFDTAADALAAATQITSVPAILPRVVAVDGGMRIVLPGDPDYHADGAFRTEDRPWMGQVTEAARGITESTPSYTAPATTGFGPDEDVEL